MSISQGPDSTATSRELYDGEQGLAALEACFGLTRQESRKRRIRLLLVEVERKILQWEAQPADELMADNETISRLFGATERVSMSAYFNDGRLPDVWWAELCVELEQNGLYDRLIKQIHRETNARSARAAVRQKADSFTGPKRVTPDNEAALLAAARAAALEVGAHLDAMEKLDDSGLRSNSRRILQWHDALVESFSFSLPEGKGHEPAVLEYREWMRVRLTKFMQEWGQVLSSIPNNGAERLLALVERVNRLMAASQFLSDSTTASANARWARLEPVKAWVIAQRGLGAPESRAAFVRRLLPQVRLMAREAGETLSGDDQAVIRTVTGWLRNAGVR